MARCTDRRHSIRACSITGLGGVALATDDVVTGEAAIRAVSLQNGLAKVTCERPTVLGTPAEPAACHLYINSGHISSSHEDVWLRCVPEYYGDWSFYAAPITVTCDRIRVVEASDEACEIAMVWDAHALNVAYLNNVGVLWRDKQNAPFYVEGGGFRYITSTTVTKRVRVERGRPGYFVGWYSDPYVGPPPSRLTIGAADNNEQAWVERELGIGRSLAVGFASSGQRAYFPAWALQRDATWAAAEAAYGGAITERHWWTGIDDPTYGVMATPGFALSQYPGFPNEQETGPWWVAGIPGPDAGLPSICSFFIQQYPIESGGWQYMPSPGYAALVMHHCNTWPAPDGGVYPFQGFIGAVHHVADPTSVAVAGYDDTVAFGNEPSAALVARIAAIAAGIEWPL